MILLDINQEHFKSSSGCLPIAARDEIALKLAMLIEGECGTLGVDFTAAKFGFSRQRYFQLRSEFLKQGALALLSKKRGPKAATRCKEEVVCQVIRHRFLDPKASTDVIAQKMRQCGHPISKRSVDRIIAHFGLQKKTLSAAPPSSRRRDAGDPSHPAKKQERKSRSPQR